MGAQEASRVEVTLASTCKIMVALRSFLLILVAALAAKWLQGCGAGDCAEKGCKYDESQTTNDGKKGSIDEYIQCKTDNDCCVPVDTGDKLKAEADSLTYRQQDVEDMEKCKR